MLDHVSACAPRHRSADNLGRKIRRAVRRPKCEIGSAAISIGREKIAEPHSEHTPDAHLLVRVSAHAGAGENERGRDSTADR